MGMTGGELEDVIYGLLAGSDPQFKFKFKHDCNNYYDNEFREICLKGDVNGFNESYRYLDSRTKSNHVLSICAKKGYTDMVMHLITKFGADVNCDNGEVLKYYVKKGDLKMVEWLFDHDADVCIDNNYAIRISAKKGDLEMTKCLVKHGADIYVNNSAVIRIAIGHGHKNVADYLI